MLLDVTYHKFYILYYWALGNEVEVSNMPIAYVMHNPGTLRLISNRNKMLKPLTLKFLFDRLHVSNVYYDAPFNEGHLATRGNRCAAENQRITLN